MYFLIVDEFNHIFFLFLFLMRLVYKVYMYLKFIVWINYYAIIYII